jgi:hypothetical protein
MSMGSHLTVTDSVVQEIATALAAGRGKWTGCDWPTQFGRNRLDLRGLRPSQALLMQRATAGSEAADWRDALLWLRRVEQDASQAESEAQTAADLATRGKLREALDHVKRACGIETRYRESSIWRPLRNAIEAALFDNQEPPQGS